MGSSPACRFTAAFCVKYERRAERAAEAWKKEEEKQLEAEDAKAAALRQLNSGRMALLSGAQQAAARQGAIKRFREESEWKWLHDAYRVPIERAGASTADWAALPARSYPGGWRSTWRRRLMRWTRAIRRWLWVCTDP